MDVHYRWMTASDATTLSALAHRIWHAHYPGIISDAQIAYMLAKSYTPAQLLAQHEAGNRFLLAEVAGEMVGFASIGPLSAVGNVLISGDGVMDDAYFLHKFYLEPRLNGRGIGSAMFTALYASVGDICRLRLQVNRTNVIAIRFYRAKGFEVVLEADFDIGNGYLMQDYVMEKNTPLNDV